jgi:hypothetical protein
LACNLPLQPLPINKHLPPLSRGRECLYELGLCLCYRFVD